MAKDEQASQEELLRRRLERELLLRRYLTPEARARLANVRMVRPEKAELVEEYVIRMAAAGRIKEPLSDEQVKVLLGALEEPKREFKIRWA
ncbi:MAG: DNA-binding protein [Nitrososphaerota archaeon]